MTLLGRPCNSYFAWLPWCQHHTAQGSAMCLHTRNPPDSPYNSFGPRVSMCLLRKPQEAEQLMGKTSLQHSACSAYAYSPEACASCNQVGMGQEADKLTRPLRQAMVQYNSLRLPANKCLGYTQHVQHPFEDT